jgi:hypothetical protein
MINDIITNIIKNDEIPINMFKRAYDNVQYTLGMTIFYIENEEVLYNIPIK